MNNTSCAMSGAVIDWKLTGEDIERESFRRIEAEMGAHAFAPDEWRVARRLIHATADFSLADDLVFKNDPITAGLNALRNGASIVCDANMIKAGLSLARLRQWNSGYARESVYCHVGDADVATLAQERHCARSLVALEKARPLLNGAIILIGNAPLALARLAQWVAEGGVRPALVIGMPVGFVHVVESKNMILATGVPQIVLKGRRGGSPLAVATLHGVMEMS